MQQELTATCMRCNGSTFERQAYLQWSTAKVLQPVFQIPVADLYSQGTVQDEGDCQCLNTTVL